MQINDVIVIDVFELSFCAGFVHKGANRICLTHRKSTEAAWRRPARFTTVTIGLPLTVRTAGAGMTCNTMNPCVLSQGLGSIDYDLLVSASGCVALDSSGTGDKNRRISPPSPRCRRTTDSALYPSNAPDRQIALAQMW